MIKLKPGVSIKGIRPEMFWPIQVAGDVYRTYGAEAVVTSGTEADAPHALVSRHWAGAALDFRVHDVGSEYWEALRKRMEEACGKDFKVVLERSTGTAPHLHVSFLGLEATQKPRG